MLPIACFRGSVILEGGGSVRGARQPRVGIARVSWLARGRMGDLIAVFPVTEF